MTVMKRRCPSDHHVDSYSFHNSNATQNQAGRQIIRGNVHHAPVHHYHTTQNVTLHAAHVSESGLPDRDVTAREQIFLSEHHPSSSSAARMVGAKRKLPPADRSRYKQSLTFSEMGSRHATIKSAHSETCEWLLEKEEYTDWLNQERLSHHGGILWIKGKPGTGKSTLAAYVISSMETNSTNMTILTFFFHARGNELQRSTEGMYRSILYQLLDEHPHLEAVLETQPILADEKGHPRWTVTVLEKLLREAVMSFRRRALTLFVDALDECHEDQIRELIRFLERLSQDALVHKVELRIWFSSRHYPHVTIGKGIYLILEDQRGHDQDLVSYVDSELEIRDGPRAQLLRQEILDRASGVFLWVVLVVAILNREYDRGRVHTLARRLQEVPGHLGGLFRDVLIDQPHEELVLCLQWVLFAMRPLRVDELYLGILIALEPDSLSEANSQEVTKSDMMRFVLDASRGLVEETKDETRTVQLIHESVRNYLLQGVGLESQIFGPADSFPARSHEVLKRCCQTYYQHPSVLGHRAIDYQNSIDSVPDLAALQQRIRDKFPFLNYAVHHVLIHSNEAHGKGCPQDAFIETFDLKEWIFMRDLIEVRDGISRSRAVGKRSGVDSSRSARWSANCGRHRRASPVGILLQVLAERGLWRLVELELQRLSATDIHGHAFESAVAAAQAAGSKDTLIALLSASGPSVGGQTGGKANFHLHDTDLERTVTSLLQAIDLGSHPSLLLWAVRHGNAAAVRVFLACGKVRTRYVDRFGVNLLTLAARYGCLDIVKLLLSRNEFLADVKSHYGQTPLAQAASRGHFRVVEYLLGRGDVAADSRDSTGRTPLSRAAAEDRYSVVEILLSRHDVNPNSRDSQYGRTPLSWAAAQGHRDVVQLLLSHQDVKPNIPDRDGQTPFLWAAANDRKEVVHLFLRCKNVDFDRKDSRGRSPQDLAASKGHAGMVALLSSTAQEWHIAQSTVTQPRIKIQRLD